jgi:hypothetical protein
MVTTYVLKNRLTENVRSLCVFPVNGYKRRV